MQTKITEKCALFFVVQFSSLKWQRKIKGVSKIEETAFCVGIFSVVVQCEVGKESLGRQGWHSTLSRFSHQHNLLFLLFIIEFCTDELRITKSGWVEHKALWWIVIFFDEERSAIYFLSFVCSLYDTHSKNDQLHLEGTVPWCQPWLICCWFQEHSETK